MRFSLFRLLLYLESLRVVELDEALASGTSGSLLNAADTADPFIHIHIIGKYLSKRTEPLQKKR